MARSYKSWEEACDQARNVFGPAAADATLREGINECWTNLPERKRTSLDVEKIVWHLTNRALKDLRNILAAGEPADAGRLLQLDLTVRRAIAMHWMQTSGAHKTIRLVEDKVRRAAHEVLAELLAEIQAERQGELQAGPAARGDADIRPRPDYLMRSAVRMCRDAIPLPDRSAEVLRSRLDLLLDRALMDWREDLAIFSRPQPLAGPRDKPQVGAITDLFGPGAADTKIRQGTGMCWSMTPADRRTFANVQAVLRRLVQRILRELADDARTFSKIPSFVGPGLIDRNLRNALLFCWEQTPDGPTKASDVEAGIRRLVKDILGAQRGNGRAEPASGRAEPAAPVLSERPSTRDFLTQALFMCRETLFLEQAVANAAEKAEGKVPLKTEDNAAEDPREKGREESQDQAADDEFRRLVDRAIRDLHEDAVTFLQ